MPQKGKSSQWLLAGSILLGLLVGISFVAWRLLLKPDPANSVVKHKVDTPPDKALKYWTPERMRKAQPARMPHVDAPNQEKPQPKNTPREPGNDSLNK